MVHTEEEQLAGFDVKVADLLVYLRHAREVTAAFPVGTSPWHIQEIALMKKNTRTVKTHQKPGKPVESKRTGLLIAFEGGDGTGKHTQAKALWQRLRRAAYPVTLVEEPGSTLLGKLLRSWLTVPPASLPDIPAESPLLAAKTDLALPHIMLRSVAPRAELLLFVLARAQLVEEVIKPRLAEGDTVICARYAPSTVAYQGYGQGLRLDLVKEANKIATQGLEPDIVFLLDLPPEQGLARKNKEKSQDAMDHFEDKTLSFHHRVRQGYLEMAAADPRRWVVIDATLPQAEIKRIVWDRVKPLLGKAKP